MNYNAIDNICSGIEIMMRTKSEFGAPLVLAMAAEELIRQRMADIEAGSFTNVQTNEWFTKCQKGLEVGYLPKMKALKEGMKLESSEFSNPTWMDSAKRIVTADDMVKHSRV